MPLILHQRSLVSSSAPDPWLSVQPSRNCKVVSFNHQPFYWCFRKKRRGLRLSLLDDGNLKLNYSFPDFGRHTLNFSRSRRSGLLLPFASADDGVTVNGSPRASAGGEVEELRVKLDQSLQGEDCSTGLVQSLHDAARVFELAIRDQSLSSKVSWFSTAWIGIDKTAWIKELSYQASVYSLLQAASEISSRGDGRDRDINIFVQRRSGKVMPLVSENASDLSLLMLALSCIAAIMKLGPTKISCAQFFSSMPDTTGRLMDMLIEFVPIRQAYHSVKDIGLRREFLVHFGPRAAANRVKNDRHTEEVMFWVSLVQKQLQKAIDRERIWSKLTTCESIEVLERDLAIFGFFIALGRSTQSFLSANGFDSVDEPIEELMRYLIGGSVLYYPQLSSISSYQLYVEVVCEELDWLPFYPGSSNSFKRNMGHTRKEESPPNPEAIPLALDACSHWIQSFIKYSKWLENPSNVKAAGFLSKGHEKLKVCLEELGIQKTTSGTYSPTELETDSFDKALESVEEALMRLQGLLQELHMSSSTSGKEHLKAACSDLERIRRLKKEAEFLEASFRAKEASLQQEGDASDSSSVSNERQHSKGKASKRASINRDSGSRVSKPRGLWSFLVRPSNKSSDLGMSMANANDDECFEQRTAGTVSSYSESNEIQRFELLRNELIELEKRVQKSADRSEYEEEDIQTTDESFSQRNEVKGPNLVRVQKKESIIEKSLDKLKGTSTDVWQGTQLLAIDVAAAMGLLRRVVIGDELTEKEKQALRRTLTDLASVVPIGFLMLLPVTAVGHAAMLAAIQRYVPSLIPSTYGPERLDLLRQLEKVKEMEDEVNSKDNADEKPSK
ncbi:uncharacterized protein LOC113775006 isoform X4 [Coffea eugenioides]|uniref:uncharacterized protein LOC113775006 isoform X4 n=1 Tax=Coffea eugenioides TaxID=49369 RepID=UPI000F608F7B|nr:uncharacterized protein LOC113775006 isoform X4 [Coffea eugenioides]